MSTFDRLGVSRTQFETQPERGLARVLPLRMVALTDTSQVIATAGDFDLRIEKLFVANIGTAGAVSFWVAPAATASGDANAIAKGVVAAANETVTMLDGLLVEPGYTLRGACAAGNTINVMGWATVRLGGGA